MGNSDGDGVLNLCFANCDPLLQDCPGHELCLPDSGTRFECQADDFAQRTGIRCVMQCEDDAIAPDADTSLALFRIAQETLTNVVKHAHASLVVMRLHRERANIVFEVRDNSRGITEADMAKSRSFGLRGIRERVHSLNGEISIGAGEHGGTIVVLRIPEQAHAESAITDEPQGTLF